MTTKHSGGWELDLPYTIFNSIKKGPNCYQSLIPSPYWMIASFIRAGILFLEKFSCKPKLIWIIHLRFHHTEKSSMFHMGERLTIAI